MANWGSAKKLRIDFRRRLRAILEGDDDDDVLGREEGMISIIAILTMFFFFLLAAVVANIGLVVNQKTKCKTPPTRWRSHARFSERGRSMPLRRPII